jgi:hypothetical protein
MSKFQTVLLAILSAVVAGALYKFVPDDKTLAVGMAGLSVYLLGWVRQHPQDKPAAIDVVNTTGPGAAA